MGDPLIRVCSLHKTYRLGGVSVPALRGISINLYRGEFVVIMGPSGSGKSTLLNLLGLLDRPSDGRYLLEGKEVAGLDPDERALTRRTKIGMVFQNFNLLGRSTAQENVELPLIYSRVRRGERHRRAAAALALMGLSDRWHHLPAQLSGGEQQRVSLARALVNDPVLILADEPTGALDSVTRLEILAYFQALNDAGRTVVLVTHDAEVARFARRIISMQDGRAIRDEPVMHRKEALTELAQLRDTDVHENMTTE
jgi:putative ABC transport system ATP-binding protein